MGYRNTTRGTAAYKTVLAGAVLLLASISSCAVPPGEPPEPSASASVRQWTAHTTADGLLRFEYPQDWTVTEVEALANDPAGGVSLEISDGSGRVLARLDTGVITDMSCSRPDRPAAYAEYESVPMPALGSAQGTQQRFVYRSLAPSGPRAAQATYAVVSGVQQGGCGLFDFFSLTPSSGGRFAGEYSGASPDDVPAYLDGAEQYQQTQEYQDLRRMLTSLRNAS